MKIKVYIGYAFILGIFISCASRPAMVMAPPPETAMESVIYRIQENPPEIDRYFILDETGDIVVKAELSETEHFEVVYHMKNSSFDKSITPGIIDGYWIPFTVKSLDTGEVRQNHFFWSPREDDSGLLLTFDDDFFETWERNFDLFDQYGAAVTFFVQGEYDPFCIAALERGHDVGYHTINHLNLPKVSSEVFNEETSSQTEIFRNAGVPLTSFAYPFGLSEPWMHEELLKTYKILRGYGVTFRLYDRAQIRDGYIISKALDNILFKQDEGFEAIVDLMFRTVKFLGRDLILPLTSHEISDSADWGIKPRRLEYLLQSANDLQLNFYRFKDF